MKKIGIYNENCAGAGSRCWDEALIERKSSDITIYAASTAKQWEAVKELAEECIARPVLGGHEAFLNKVGHELMAWYETAGPVKGGKNEKH